MPVRPRYPGVIDDRPLVVCGEAFEPVAANTLVQLRERHAPPELGHIVVAGTQREFDLCADSRGRNEGPAEHELWKLDQDALVHPAARQDIGGRSESKDVAGRVKPEK